MPKGIIFGGSDMNDEYWRRFKEYRVAGLTTQQAMIRAHEDMIA